MLTKIKLIRNVGCFNQLTCKEELKQTTLIYGENAAGKTTLSHILHSLARDASKEILERQRKSETPLPPEIRLEHFEGKISFQNGSWERSSFAAPIVVFNDFYVDENVYSGLSVEKEQRDNLCKIVLGAEGVKLVQELEGLKQRRAELKKALAAQEAELQKYAGPLTVDQFDALPWQDDLNEKIVEVDAEIKQAEQAETIKNAAAFDSISLPVFGSTQVSALLERSLSDVEETTLNRARAHFASLGADGENWTATGLALAPSGDVCPFCGQEIRDDSLLTAYRQYFNDEYKRFVTELRSDLDATLAELRDVWSRLNTLKSSLPPKRDYWRQYVPDLPESPDFKSILETVAALGKRFQAVAQDKKSSPLEPLVLPEKLTAALKLYAEVRTSFLNAYQRFLDANEEIQRIKKNVLNADKSTLEKQKRELKLTKIRYSDDVLQLFENRQKKQDEYAKTEDDVKTREAGLKCYEETVFKTFLSTTNRYLEILGVDFSVVDLRQNTRGKSGSSVDYHLTINGEKTSNLSKEFKYVLSAGDRRTLALAYFFASLENNTNLKNAIVVFDDPFTSLDEHRMEATAAEICKLQDQCRQMIIVSHSAPFLEKIYDLIQWNPGVCEKAEKTRRLPLCLRLSRRGDQNSLKEWGIEELKRTAYDISFASVLDYCERRENDIKAVAHNLRPVLEGYCRVAFQPYYRPGMLLGPFCEEMASRQETQTARVEFDLRELQELTNYANRFQHHRDVSPLLNEREFETYARRILKFVGYKLEK